MKTQDITKKELKTGFPFFCYGNQFALCGQPQIRDMKDFKEQSWTHVINLRSPQELDSLDFKMEDQCKELGLNYYLIPIFTEGDLNQEALIKVHELLSEATDDQKFVIHCASGARSVIALIAHFLFLKTYTASEVPALAEKFQFHQTNMLNRLLQIMEVR